MLFESTFLWTMWFSHLSTQGYHVTGIIFMDHMIKEETNITEGRESGDISDGKAMDHKNNASYMITLGRQMRKSHGS